MSITRFLENVIMTLQDVRGHHTTSAQRQLGERLTTELAVLSRSPSAGPQLDFWKATCDELYECARFQDPMTFLRWPPIAMTMTGGTSPDGIAAYRILQRSPRWPTWSKIIRHPNYGASRPFLPNLSTNCITVQHASHLEIFLQRTGHSFLDADCIVDLGAGYGAMCMVARRLGYRGQYVIFDQPPVLALQRYYLALNGIDANYGTGDVALCRSLSETEEISRRFKTVSVVSTWALSEMPVELRQQAEPLLASATKVLLAYQADFEGIGNREYFTGLTQRITAPWKHFEIDFFPRNFYVFKVEA